MNRRLFISLALLICLLLSTTGAAAEIHPLPSQQPTPTQASVTVSSTSGWQETPLILQQGDQFTISYTSGSWTVDFRNYQYVGPEGYTAAIDSLIPPDCKTISSLPYARLLGRVEGGQSFSVGQGGAFTADASGPLLLRINDQDNCLNDNAGSITMTVEKVSGAIDLEVTAIQASASPICTGSDVDFQAYIRNNGTAASGGFDIRWYVDAQIFDGGHYSIPGGTIDPHGHFWSNIPSGQHSLTFIADYGNFIPETNEENNEKTLSFTAINCSITNPMPNLASLSPASATAGGMAFTLTVNGTNFVDGSVIRWNGSDRTTTYISNTQLTASIPNTDITQAGTANITVFNAAPGGGTSAVLPFLISSSTTKSWTIMLYLAGDTGGIDNGLVHSAFARALSNLEQTTHPNVRVVALIDGPATLDTFRVTFTPQAQYQPLGEKRMDDPATLVEFVQGAQRDFPADYYYLAIADHANGVQGIAWDTTSNANRTALLTPSEIRQALVTITDNGARPIDVLHFDGCSFGLLEDAVSAQGLARYLVASENIGWGVFAYADYRATIGSTTTPAEFARSVAQRYAQRVGDQQYPYTISVLDLSRLDGVLAALNSFADGLTSFASATQSNRTLLASIRSQSQKFDSGGTPFLEITIDDTFVDLVDFAARAKQQIGSAGVPAAADSLIAAVTGPQPLVVYEAHRSGSFDYGGELHTWNLDGAHGVSIYYPPKSAGANFGNYINGATFPTFDSASHWSNYLRAGVPPLGIGDPLPNDGPDPLAPLLPTHSMIYLPFARR